MPLVSSSSPFVVRVPIVCTLPFGQLVRESKCCSERRQAGRNAHPEAPMGLSGCTGQHQASEGGGGGRVSRNQAVKFSAFTQWCGDQDKTKVAEIQDAADKIEMFDAEIQKAESEIRGHTSRIDELNEDVGRWKRDTTSTSEVRDKEAADFRTTLQDYSESLDALDRAIVLLKKQAFDRPQADMLQVRFRICLCCALVAPIVVVILSVVLECHGSVR